MHHLRRLFTGSSSIRFTGGHDCRHDRGGLAVVPVALWANDSRSARDSLSTRRVTGNDSFVDAEVDDTTGIGAGSWLGNSPGGVLDGARKYVDGGGRGGRSDCFLPPSANLSGTESLGW